jgi:hypothetical protein
MCHKFWQRSLPEKYSCVQFTARVQLFSLAQDTLRAVTASAGVLATYLLNSPNLVRKSLESLAKLRI